MVCSTEIGDRTKSPLKHKNCYYLILTVEYGKFI